MLESPELPELWGLTARRCMMVNRTVYDVCSSMLFSDVGACVLLILEILSCLLRSIFDRTVASYRYIWKLASSNILAPLTTTLEVSLALSLMCCVDILIVSVLESIVPFHILMAAIVPSEILHTALAYVSVILLGDIHK